MEGMAHEPLRVVVADELPPAAFEQLARPGWDVVATFGRPREELTQALAGADALVVRSATRVTADLIGQAPRLRVIARAGTGVDTIDVDAATERGILVINAPGANTVSVAELTMAFILALARRVPAADASMKAGQWEKKKFTGGEVQGRTLGLVGFGRIGQEVARRAQAFGMSVIAFDPYLSPEAMAGAGATPAALESLLAQSDVISLHAPASPQTRHLINRERLARCRKGVFIVNTARGDLVDPAALAAAIQDGHVAGAALDVFEKEPPADATLQSLPEVIATPHIGASTREGQDRVGIETVEALADFLDRGLIRNAVNAPAVPPAIYGRMLPYVRLARLLGRVAASVAEGPLTGVGIRTYGELAELPEAPLSSAVLEGVLVALRCENVTPVNATATATRRGIEIVRSHSSRDRPYPGLISVKVRTSNAEHWLEGTLSASREPRLVLLDGVRVDAPLAGELILIWNRDQPGVIGEIGTRLGRHGINIANFSLGRTSNGRAVGVLDVDTGGASNAVTEAVDDLRGVRHVDRVAMIDLKET
jgi:D-3-phosphoglycerate dehydrogenase